MRCFIAWRDNTAADLVCACGALLSPGSLPRGIYELKSPIPDDSRATSPSLSTTSSGILKESDLGYGKSHGYGPAHGGPTGPGDAPAGADEEPSIESDRARRAPAQRGLMTE
jgi:hypothetical protein